MHKCALTNKQLYKKEIPKKSTIKFKIHRNITTCFLTIRSILYTEIQTDNNYRKLRFLKDEKVLYLIIPFILHHTLSTLYAIIGL